MSDWFETKSGLWDMTWAQLDLGVRDASHPCRLVSFSTVSPAGLPESRNVVLRNADADAKFCEVQTDTQSSKMESLRAHPFAALLWWVESLDLQIRMQCRVEILEGTSVDDDWAAVPASSRVSYGTLPAPGTPIEDALAYQKPPVRERFCVLRCHLKHLDLIHLGKDHRRVAYTQARDWDGQWLSP